MRKIYRTVVPCILLLLPIALLAQDRTALEALYHSTDGPNWSDSEGWLTDRPSNEWYGVTVIDGRVVALHLVDNGLSGELPSEIGLLNELRFLDLRWNDLRGEIPGALGNLVELESLMLGSNGFSGSIPPALGQIRDLTQLDLSYNQLTGSVPVELGYLTRLQGLGLHHNELTGELTASLGDATELRRIIVSHNGLSGVVPERLEQLPELEHLNIVNTRLSEARGELVRPEELSGSDVLNESVAPMPESDYVRGIIEQTMAAVHVRDGLLWVNLIELPEGLPVDQLVDVIEQTNQQLLESGERIESVDDFNRVINVYGVGTIELQEEPPAFTPGAPFGARSGTAPIVPMVFSTGSGDGLHGGTFAKFNADG